tara:strand:- start:159 stop:683 length:525 start_codon:yes stop_codon:yes gene_type:complete
MKLKKYSFKKVQSTNDIAIKLVKSGVKKGIIISEQQTKGRGQRGNKWISNRGNLFLTVFFKISKKISIKKITRINIMIIQKIISKLVNINASIKLPNDILINKKKVCGILQEIIFKNSFKFLIVGIGINVERSPKLTKYETTYLNFYKKNKIKKLMIYNKIKLSYEKNANLFNR